jgi:hypothetical protein
MREAGLVTKRIQGARGYTQLRKEDVDRRFPGLLDSVINADDPALVRPSAPHPAVNYGRTGFVPRLPDHRANPYLPARDSKVPT